MAALAAVGMVLLAGPARAQTIFQWSAAGSGQFENSVNWSPSGGPPGTLDTARFLLGGSPLSVSFAAPRVTRVLRIDDSDVTLQLGGQTYTVTGASPALLVLTSLSGTVRVSNGTLASDSALVDSISPLGTGAVHVLPGGTWMNAGEAVVGDAGHGIVTLSPLTQASSAATILSRLPGSDADFLMHGPMAAWATSGDFIAGQSGNGLMFLDAGAVLQCHSAAIAEQSTAGFTVIVDGPGTQWNMPAGNTIVAGLGHGSLQLRAGSAMSSGPRASIADQAGAVGSVTVDGGPVGRASWSIAGDLDVGRGGDGSLVLLNPRGLGAVVTVGGGLMIGALPGATGTVEIAGGGAFIAVTGLTTIGDAGEGSVNVRSGAGFHTGPAFVGRSAGGSGGVVLDGPTTLWTAPEVTIGPAAPATVRLTNSSKLWSAQLTVAGNGRLEGSGMVEAAVVSTGVVSPGSSAGELLITGTFVQNASAVLEIELGGARPGTDHDLLTVTGLAMLDGSLHVALIDSFQPAPGQQFVILDAGSIRGQFARLIAPPGFSVAYGPNQVTLTACAGADLNCDGHVNGLDVAILLGQWTGAALYAPCPPFRPADLNQDCRVNGLDLATMLGAWAP